MICIGRAADSYSVPPVRKQMLCSVNSMKKIISGSATIDDEVQSLELSYA